METSEHCSCKSVEYTFSDHLHLNAGYLFCENVKVKDIQQQLETLYPDCPSPVFVYSRAQVVDNVRAYRKGLDEAGLPYHLGFSIKANYNPEILKLLQDEGCGMVCVSGHEIMLALRLGVDPGKIIYNGTGKYRWDLKLAVDKGCLINVDSLFDLRHLVAVAKDVGKKARAMLRLNPEIDPLVHHFLATGVAASKFGIQEAQLDEVLNVIREEKDIVDLVGLHCHLGSTIDNIRVFRDCLDAMLALVVRVKKEGFVNLQYINLGGGLGIDYTRHEERTRPEQEMKPVSQDETNNFIQLVEKRFQSSPTSYNQVHSMVSEYLNTGFFTAPLDTVVQRMLEVLGDHPDLVRAFNQMVPASLNVQVQMPTPEDLVSVVKNKLAGTGMGVILEPGRSLVGNVATLVSRTLGWKRNGPTNYMVVDASMNEVIRPSLYSAYHHIELTEPSQSAHLGRAVFDVVGPVCECSDFLGKHRLLPYPHEGCGVAIFDGGAYCSSMSSNYNMRMRPVEVLVDRDKWKVIRRPDTLHDLLAPFTVDTDTGDHDLTQNN